MISTNRRDSFQRRMTFVAPPERPQSAAIPTPAGRTIYAASRDVADRSLAFLLLVLTAPVMLFGAALVKLTSRGPVIYQQKRLGLHGEVFTIYKLRTMVNNCEQVSGPRWAVVGDTRVTRVGAFLRRTHIDELPQLWNIVRGEMSLVGPRPERPEFVAVLQEAIPQYKARLRVRPGLTGLAQVQLAADTDLECVRRKLAYDLYYLSRAGFGLDLRILLSTALHLMRVPFEWLRVLFGLPEESVVRAAFQAVEL